MPLPALAALLIKAGAPLLANAAIAKGREWLESKTGVKLNEGAEISSDDAARLRQYELEHEEELARIRLEDNRIGAELEGKYLEDRQDARHRDVEFVRAGRQNVRGDVLAYLAIGGLLATIILVFIAEIDQTQKEILMFVLGVLSGLVKDTYSFEFGSSKDAAKSMNTMTKWLDKE